MGGRSPGVMARCRRALLVHSCFPSAHAQFCVRTCGSVCACMSECVNAWLCTSRSSISLYNHVTLHHMACKQTNHVDMCWRFATLRSTQDRSPRILTANLTCLHSWVDILYHAHLWSSASFWMSLGCQDKSAQHRYPSVISRMCRSPSPPTRDLLAVHKS